MAETQGTWRSNIMSYIVEYTHFLYIVEATSDVIWLVDTIIFITHEILL